MDSNFIDYCYEALATTSYFLLINLFNGYFLLSTNIPHGGADSVAAWLAQINNPERTLSK